MSVSLAPAVRSLYAAFEQVPRPGSIDYCACCFTADEERAVLAGVPLSMLPADAVQPYAADVMLTVGSTADFRYFLPRILEIACVEGFGWPDLESVAGRLRFAEWTTWENGERDAVRAFLAALWTHTLTCVPAASQVDVDTVLCAIGNAEDDLTGYLAEWTSALTSPTTTGEATTGEAATGEAATGEAASGTTTNRTTTSGAAADAQLRSFLGFGNRAERQLVNAFWRGRESQADQVRAWLSRPELRSVVDAATAVVER